MLWAWKDNQMVGRMGTTPGGDLGLQLEKELQEWPVKEAGSSNNGLEA